MPDSDIRVVGPEDVVAVWGAVHPPIEDGLGGSVPTFIDILSPPGRIIPVGCDSNIAGGPVRPGMGDKTIAGHIDAVLAGRSA
jgi:hypothetical protein